MNKYIVILGILFSSLSYSYDETYIQCRGDKFFRIDDPEEPGVLSKFLSKDEEFSARIYSYHNSSMEGYRISLSRFHENESGKGILFPTKFYPSEDWIKSEGVTLRYNLLSLKADECKIKEQLLGPTVTIHGRKTCRDENWHVYIDRVEGEAWFVLPEKVCATGCDATPIRFEHSPAYFGLPPAYPEEKYVKAIRYGSCEKTTKRKIKKYFSQIEKANKPVQAKVKTKF